MTLPLTTEQLETLANGVRIIVLRALGDADAARDVTQETMARLLDALGKGQLRDPERLGAFARGIAQHVIVDHQRAAARLVTLPEDIAPTDAPNALDTLVRDEDVARMRAALDCLSPGDRELLRLSFVENLSSRAVASRLQEPGERVRKRKSRALERLREVFFSMIGGHDSGPSATKEQPVRDEPVAPAEAE